MNLIFPKLVERPDIAADLPSPLRQHGVKCYIMGMLRVFVGLEPSGWHLSVSHPHRYPSWDEIKHLRYKLCPHDVTMAIILPPTDEYVNLSENCFHLHQIPNEQ